jgi:hypothetical protein
MLTPRKKISREPFGVTTSKRSPAARIPWTGLRAAGADEGGGAARAAGADDEGEQAAAAVAKNAASAAARSAGREVPGAVVRMG